MHVQRWMLSSAVLGAALFAAPAEAARLEEIAVIQSSEDPEFLAPRCDRCVRIDAAAPMSLPGKVRAIVASGHSEHGRYLGLYTEDFVWLLQSLAPELEWLVLDTCFGAQAELLIAIEEAGLHIKLIVAAAFTIPAHGLSYGTLFDGQAILETDLDKIECCTYAPRALTYIRPGASAHVRELERESIRRARKCALDRPLASVLPNLYPASGGGPIGGAVLINIPPDLWPEGCRLPR